MWDTLSATRISNYLRRRSEEKRNNEIVKPVSRARALRPMTICPSYFVSLCARRSTFPWFPVSSSLS